MDICTQKPFLIIRKHKGMRYITSALALFALLLLPAAGRAQLTVTDNQTAAQLVQQLIGDNVAILNPVLTCPQGNSGKFETVTSNLGLDGGIVLCTGAAKTDLANGIVGVNGHSTLSVGQNSGGPGDPEMSSIIGGLPTFDACILQFDFVPDVDTTSTLRFKYVFGSEEYTGFTCSQFNDAFAFLLNGPGYSNTNIALVPGTTVPVAINSVNSGTPSGGYPLSNCTGMGQGAPFPAFFVQNLPTGTTVTFDGFTTVLEAQAIVQPCDTYHIKLAVADASDGALNSGVFLKKNSFSVDTVTLNLDGVIASDKGYLVEGCTPADIVATRNQANGRKKKICLSFGGTATNGVDYPFLPDSIVIMPGQTTASLTLDPIQDLLSEPGFETVIIRRLNCCTQTVIDSVVVKIRDSLKLDMLSVDTAVCAGSQVRLQASGDPEFDFSWTPTVNVQSPTDSYTVAHPMETTTYTIKASFKSCPDVEKSFNVRVEPIPQVSIMPADSVICLRDSMQFRVDVQPASFSPYNYYWAPHMYLSDPYAQNPKFYNIDVRDHTLVLAVQTPLGCIGLDTATLHTRPPMDLFDVSADHMIKYGSSTQLHASGADYYVWLPPGTIDNANIYNPMATPTEPTIYTVIGWNKFGCVDSAKVKVDIDYTMSEFLPSAFTPNGDGRNDVFNINKTWKFQKLLEFRVFDRWGQQVYTSVNINEGWDGKYQGQDQPMGVYHYIIRAARPDGQIKTYKGDVTLVR